MQWRVDIFFVDQNTARDSRPLDKLIHPIENTQQCRLSTTRRTYYPGYQIPLDIHIDVLERLELMVIQVEVCRGDYHPNLPRM
jgi:hypothetical protein